jgi:hypothetical protein
MSVGNHGAAFRVHLLTFRAEYPNRTARPMIQTWRELEFVRSRAQLTPFHIRLRPKAVWYDTPTFHAAVVSVVLHVGLVVMLATSSIRLQFDASVRPKPLLDGDLDVVFLTPKEVRRIVRQTTPSTLATTARHAEPAQPETSQSFRSKPLETRPAKSAPRVEPKRSTPPKPSRQSLRSVPPTRMASRRVVRRDSDTPNALVPTTARLPGSEASFLSALPLELPTAFAATPVVGTGKLRDELPEPVYQTPERAAAGSASDAGDSPEGDIANDGTPSGRRRAQIGRSLREIAEAVAKGDGPRAVDVVFLLDLSGSMDNNIRAVADNLVGTMDYLRRRGYDVTFGVVKFKVSTIRVFPQTRDAERLRRLLDNFQVGGDERALDAITKAVRKVRFRENVERRLILVTDEPLKGTGTFNDILALVRAEKIVVDVIGLNDLEHRQLAAQTGGTWHPIPGEDG